VLGLVQSDRVHRDVYLSAHVFELEMERIFLRTWIYVGHESELPTTGAFKTTRLGNRSVIVSRDASGSLAVLYNRCRHRSASVCQLPCGTTNFFRCNFHGWTYDLGGKLTATPYPEGYEALDHEALSLEAAPRVDVYRGLIFACFNPRVVPLREHLGSAAEYIDRFMDHVPGHSLQLTRDAHRLRHDGNWKLQVENTLDGYHANFTHKSFFGVLQQRTAQASRYVSAERVSDSIALENGHALLDQQNAAAGALHRRLATLPGAPPVDADLAIHFGIADAEAVYNATPGPGFNLAIFPNLAFVGIHIREIQPVAVDRTEIILRPTLVPDVPDPLNRLRLRYHELFYGPAGFGQPDDLEMFDRVTAGMRTGDDPWIRLDRGLHREVVDDHGHRRADITDETPQRAQYRQWRQLMEAN
jgi:phenylpropionate dioxygenase-like ring-hydroxylating dioxygenase large terminal subunit